MYKKLLYFFYYILNSKLRYKLPEIFLRKLKIIFDKDYVNKINFDNHYKIFSKKDVYQSLDINEIIKPQEIYKDIFDKSKSIVNNNPYKLGGAGDLEILYNLAKLKNMNNILETGVANGWSSLAILLSIQETNNKKLTSIDLPYPYKNSDKYIGCVVPNNLRKNWSLIIDNDKKVLTDFLNKKLKFDLVHYDSDKSYEGRINSYELIWKLLNHNGILISDDISDNNAFIFFSKSKNLIPIIYKHESKMIGILRK